MTVNAAKRRRATQLGALSAVVALAATIGVTAVGARTLWNSEGGRSASPGVAELTFPETTTALLAGVDTDGSLASLAVLVLAPGGIGGTVISLPVNADASWGNGETRLPLDASFRERGTESLVTEAEVALGVSFDVVEVADVARLGTLLAPIGDVAVELPRDVVNAAGDQVAAAGAATLEANALAGVLTARSTATPAAAGADVAAAVWQGVVSAIGEGGSATPTAPVGEPTIETVVGGFTAGPAATWPLRGAPFGAAVNPDGVDVVGLDRSETAFVFGQLAPGKVSALNPGLSFRVVSSFSDDQRRGTGHTNASLAYAAVAGLVFVRANVISVDTAAGTAPARTRIEVASSGLNSAGLEAMFGEGLEVVESAAPIVGVDAVVVLGESFLAALETPDPEGTATVSSVAQDVSGVEPVPPTAGDD